MNKILLDVIKELRRDWTSEELQSTLEDYKQYKLDNLPHICRSCGNDVRINNRITQPCKDTGSKELLCICGKPEDHTRHYGIEEFLDNVL